MSPAGDNASRGHYSTGHISRAYSGAIGALLDLPSTGSPVAWWRGDVGTAAMWDDRLGSAHLLQATEANQPSLGAVAGFATDAFTFATNDYFTTTDATLIAEAAGDDQPWTIILAGLVDDTAGAATAFAWSDASVSNVFHFFDVNTGTIRSRRRDGTLNLLASGSDGFPAASVVAVRFSGTSIQAYLNGVIDLGPTAMDTAACAFDTLAVGARVGSGGPTSYLEGSIADMAVYGSALSDADLNSISIDYFGAVHGISVAEI